ncbi:T9SS type A sorting domain-containing protein [Polaribacter pectinis]|uniref:T9SS type A sorting domain-containing protein n=1 Tax=Polaribacter pectinis TaxID=2738844 RepID=A0A7G9L9K7_9FLAO|nr:T9SS type A sorting domain-containing protein [Polaribacter pectinis]QNM85306.1 T9SS type A sorting domain-containing protein [Polaribacter pectinis]
MKKTLLLITILFVSTFGFSQTYDNSTYFISELIPSPPNSSSLINDSDNASIPDYQSDVDDGIEYFEFRGTPNATIDNDVYFIMIDGDGDDSDVGANIGKVRDAVNLSGLQFGANGILAIVVDITMDSGALGADGTLDISGTKWINPYATDLASSGANVVTIQLTASSIDWTDEDPSGDGINETLNKFNISSKTPDIGYDGSISDQSATYMIVKSTAGNPKNELVDSNEDGVLDGAATSWTIYDSVSILDDDDITTGNSEVGEFGYGKIIFVERLLSTDPLLHFDASISPTIVTLDQYPNYVARQGVKTGYAATTDGVDNDDWMAGRVNSLSYPSWKFSSNAARNIPTSLSSTNLATSTYGEVNPDFSATASIDGVFTSKVSVYPNPANEFVTISSAVEINKVEVYNLLGKKVISTSKLNNNNLDISSLAKGVYMMKLTSGESVASKKLIKK